MLLVGSVTPSGAAPCDKADHFSVVLTGLTPVDLSETSHSLTATVTALNACNETDSSYKGATLRASGTTANGIFASSGAAGIGDVNLRFRQGVATAVVTPSSDALGVKLTAIDGNDPPLFQSDSASFNVFDSVCEATEDDCETTIGSTKGSGGTQVTVDLPARTGRLPRPEPGWLHGSHLHRGAGRALLRSARPTSSRRRRVLGPN